MLLLCACGGAERRGEGGRPPALSVAEEASAIAQVEAVLDGWHRAAAEADEEAYFAAFTDDAVFLGTDATERWGVEAFRAYAHPHFARGRAWAFRATRRAVRLEAGGALAYFDEDLDTEGLGPARGSGVLRRGEDGAFRILHYNLTITVPNERFAEVRALLASPPPIQDQVEAPAEPGSAE